MILSNMLIIMMIIMFSMLIMNLNIINDQIFCILLNYLFMISMYLDFNSMNLMFSYFMFEMSLLLIFYMIMKWGYGEFRFNSTFYLLF